jgi:predicted MFS family arabinose efflux permease
MQWSKRQNSVAVFLLLLIFVWSPTKAIAQQSTPSHKYRTLLTITGAAGGFTAGTFVGLAIFDDARNSDRKVWTTSILGAGGGAIAGYFLGRALDRRIKKTPLAPTTGLRSFTIFPVLSKEQKGIRLSASF